MSSTQLIADSYRNYHRSIYLYIIYRIGKTEVAKDLAQDVFLRLMDHRQMLRPETVKCFIFSICRNLITDYLRHHYRTQGTTVCLSGRVPATTDETESRIIADDLAAHERKRVLRLPVQRRKVYVMSRFGHQSVAEISACLGLSVRTVENHLSIGRKEIRGYIRQCI